MGESQGTTLRRGLGILLELGSEQALVKGGLGVVQLAERLGQDKSQVSRALKTLAESGFVDRDPNSLAYRLGGHLFALAARAVDQRLVHQARLLLVGLTQEIGERSHLSVLKGAEVLTVHSESPPHTVQTVGWVGRNVPAHCTSSGRALLIDCSRAELLRLFSAHELPPAGPNAARDVDDLFERVLTARRRGFAVVDEEFEPGLVAVAAPVRDFAGNVVAALNISAPKFRLDRLDEAGARTKQFADELSARLGREIDVGSSDGTEIRDERFLRREHDGVS